MQEFGFEKWKIVWSMVFPPVIMVRTTVLDGYGICSSETLNSEEECSLICDERVVAQRKRIDAITTYFTQKMVTIKAREPIVHHLSRQGA